MLLLCLIMLKIYIFGARLPTYISHSQIKRIYLLKWKSKPGRIYALIGVSNGSNVERWSRILQGCMKCLNYEAYNCETQKAYGGPQLGGSIRSTPRGNIHRQKISPAFEIPEQTRVAAERRPAEGTLGYILGRNNKNLYNVGRSFK